MVDHGLGVALLGDIGLHERGLAASGANEFNGLSACRLAELGDDDLRALAGEQLRGDAAHPAAAARDDRDLALESHRSPSRRPSRSEYRPDRPDRPGRALAWHDEPHEMEGRGMVSPEQELLDAIGADDATRVAELVGADASLASVRDRDGVSAIMRSRYRFDRATTDALLAADPELDVFEATALGYIDRLRERLDEDPARATAYSTDGFTPLHFAAFFGKAEGARLLLGEGADVGAVSRNESIVQPLHSAAAGIHHEVCRVLIAAGADVNATQRNGFTPLHAAAQHGDDELVELLLSAGADPLAQTDAGDTPADTADGAGHVDVARRLREVGALRSV